MTIKYEIYCGLDTNGHNVNAHQLVLDLALEHFPNGHSFNVQTGRWRLNSTGEAVTEQTVVVTWLAGHDEIDASARVGKFARAYKDQAFQEAVMVVEIPIDACFV
mgnify:CR=1 FL=1